MKTIVYIILIFHAFNLSAQEPCDYIPLELNGIEPIWTHLMIDTSIIGFDDGFPNSTEWSYHDGTNHLGFSKNTTYVHDGFIYIAAEIIANQDEYGFLIDKINIETGEKEWQISVDPRSDIYSHKVLNVRVSGDNFVVEGARKMVEDDFIFNFSASTTQGYYFRKEYDLETGSLLASDTPENGDSTAFLSTQSVNFNNFFYSDSLRQHIKLPFSLVYGMRVVRNVFDANGILEIASDTVLYSNYAHQASEAIRTSASFRGKLKQGEDGSFLFIHEFIPLSTSDLPVEAVMVRYDQDFNAIDSVDLTNFISGDFTTIGITEYATDRIVLRGCKEFGDICNPFYFILDHDYNLLNSVLSQGPLGNVYGNFFVNDENEFIAMDWEFVDDGNSRLILNKEEQPFMDTVKTIDIVEPSWAASVNYFTQTDNGDWLIKFLHGCWDDGIFNSVFHELWRVSEEDFALMVSTTNINTVSDAIVISPNPAMDQISIEIEGVAIESILIYDMNGQLIDKTKVSTNNKIDISEYQSGIYSIKLIDGNRQIHQSKFVKI